jgi:DNA replication protein DnaC
MTTEHIEDLAARQAARDAFNADREREQREQLENDRAARIAAIRHTKIAEVVGNRISKAADEDPIFSRRVAETLDLITRSELGMRLIIGNVGTGKTLLACAVFRAWIKELDPGTVAKQPKCFYTTAFDLYAEYLDLRDERAAWLRKYNTADFLIIDEWDKGQTTDTARATLNKILISRGDQGQPRKMHTLVIGNIAADTDDELRRKLAEYFDPAALDRLTTTPPRLMLGESKRVKITT